MGLHVFPILIPPPRVANTFESSSCQHSLYKQILPSQNDHFRVYLLKFSENNFRELVGQNRK